MQPGPLMLAPPTKVPPRSQPVTRAVYFGPRHGLLDTRVVDRGQVAAEGADGPLIVEEYDATTVVPPGWTIHRDTRNNLVISAMPNQ